MVMVSQKVETQAEMIETNTLKLAGDAVKIYHSNEGKTVLLATKPFVKEDIKKSWWLTLSTLSLMVLAYYFTTLPIFWPIRIVLSLFAGLLTVRMFIIYHDYMHGSILKKSKVASLLMKIFGMLILTPASIWKLSHDYHHKHNSKLYGASIGSYPIMTKKRFLSSTKAERWSYLAARHPLTIMFGYFSMFMFGMVLNPFWNNPKKHADGGFAFLLHVSILATLIWLGWYEILVFTVLVPFFLSMALGAYLFYAQHNFPGVKFKTNNNEWKHADAAMESTSFMRMNGFWNWITGNIGYHHIHHLNAHIPFYRLPEAYAKVDEFKNVLETSLNPKDIVSCLRLKLWDEENQTMISLKELKSA